mgnify:FL=1
MKSRDILPLERRLNIEEDSDLFYSMDADEQFELLTEYSKALEAAEVEFMYHINNIPQEHKLLCENYSELAFEIERLSNLHSMERITSSKFRELVMKLLENSSKVRYEESMKRYREGCTDVESLINQAAYGDLQ